MKAKLLLLGRWLLARWQGLGGTIEERLVNSLTGACLVLGLWLRARGFLYDVPALWLDESQWAMLLVSRPLVDLLIRPIGFMAISKAAAAVFGPTELVLRTLPWCAGVLAMLMAPPLSRRLFTAPAARLLFVAIVALHPCAIDFSKEFKPYSVSLALHLGSLLLTLKYLQSQRDRDLAWLLGLCLVGVLFAQDLVFLYPSIFLLAGWQAFRQRQRRQLLAVALSGTLIIGSLLAQYLLIWSRISPEESDYWGEKYDVFFTGSRSYASWLLDRYVNLAAFPGYQRRFWNAEWLSTDALGALREVAVAVWVIVHGVGIVCLLWQRRFREVLLLLLPLVVLLLFNRAGFWPFGVFRTNVFLVGYMAAIAAMAFDRPPRKPRRFSALVPALLLVIVPIFAFEKGWGATKRALTYVSSLPDALAWLVAQPRDPRKGKRQTVLMDRRVCPPVRYYMDFHPEVSEALGPALRKRFTLRCVHDDAKMIPTLQRTMSKERITWVLLHRGRDAALGSPGRIPGLDVVAKVNVGSHVVLGFAKESPSRRHAVPRAP